MINPANMMGMFMNFKQNPMGFMMQNKINVPQNMVNDPKAIIQYLMDTGKLTQDDYNTAVRKAHEFQKMYNNMI